MKFKRIFGAVLVVVTVLTASANAAASGQDTSDYSFHAGKVGRTEESTPYAGMDYEGGEQGDTSAYSFRMGRVGKPWNVTE